MSPRLNLQTTVAFVEQNCIFLSIPTLPHRLVFLLSSRTLYSSCHPFFFSLFLCNPWYFSTALPPRFPSPSTFFFSLPTSFWRFEGEWGSTQLTKGEAVTSQQTWYTSICSGLKIHATGHTQSAAALSICFHLHALLRWPSFYTTGACWHAGLHSAVLQLSGLDMFRHCSYVCSYDSRWRVEVCLYGDDGSWKPSPEELCKALLASSVENVESFATGKIQTTLTVTIYWIYLNLGKMSSLFCSYSLIGDFEIFQGRQFKN